VTLFLYKILAAFFIFLTSLLILLYPLKTKGKIKHAESLELGEALASGIFLGVAFFHMLPYAMRVFYSNYPEMAFPLPEAICVGGFLLLLFLERLSLTNTLFDQKKTIPYILAIILIIHSLTEGAALGIGDVSEALMLFIAIIAHKGSESFALCITLMRHQLSFTRILFIMICFSLMTPLGIIFGAALTTGMQTQHGQFIAACFDAFAAGTFLYIATLHHIRFHQQRMGDAHGLAEFACLLLGVIMMGGAAYWA
jgi:zinc transporter ZupT